MPIVRAMVSNDSHDKRASGSVQADWIPAALRPTSAPWAVRPAIWALVAAAVVAGAGVLTGDLKATGLAYFGVACAAVFVTSGVYRTRAISLLCQGIGAAAGIVVGVSVADSVPAKVAVAAAVAMLSGMLGTIGRLSTAGALMAVVGLSFGEFARVRMPGWEQGSWYLIGTLVVAACALAGWPFYRDRAAWVAVAAVFDRAADLMQHPGGDQACAYRIELAAASAASRSEVFDHRLSLRSGMRGAGRKPRRWPSRLASLRRHTSCPVRQQPTKRSTDCGAPQPIAAKIRRFRRFQHRCRCQPLPRDLDSGCGTGCVPHCVRRPAVPRCRLGSDPRSAWRSLPP